MSPKTYCPIAGELNYLNQLALRLGANFYLVYFKGDLETRNDKETAICLISIRLFRAPFFHKIAVIQLLL